MSDHRVRALHSKNIFKSIDLKKMTAVVVIEDENYNEIEKDVKIQFVVCPTCEGKGKHVNPSIDCCGLTREDFDNDPDLMDDYLNGRYDIICYECKGKNVIPIIDQEKTDPSVIKELIGQQEAQDEFRRLQESERRMGA